MPVKTSEREYRRIDIGNLETRSDDPEHFFVEGYATTFDEPYVLSESEDLRILEQVDARAFEGCDFSDVIMQYDHQGRVFARTRNGTLEITPDAHGLHIKADLGGTTMGRQLYEEIRGGYTDRMSFGFTVAKEDRRKETRDGKPALLRTILQVGKLFDVSAVSIPANDATEISVRSLCDGAIAQAEAERLAIARQKTRIKILKLKLEVSKHDR